ncbi:MAG: hypothetical protein Q9227_000118 [Pyrenula ochraceoflavens]
MVKHQPSPQSVTRSSQRESDGDKLDSPQDGQWSAEESAGDEQAEVDGSRKRKRPRPMSVSGKSDAIEVNRAADGAQEIIMFASTKSVGNRVSALGESNNEATQQESSAYPPPTEAVSHHLPRAEAALFMQKPPIYSDSMQGPGSMINNYTGSVPASTPGLGQAEGFPQAHEQGQNGIAQRHQSMHSTGPTEYFAQSTATLESPTLNLSAEPQTSLIDPSHSFPPYDLLYALVDLYFKHINTWCPILHRKTTLDTLFGPSTLDEADRIILHAIVATTLRLSTDTRLNPENRKRFHDTSKQKVLLYGLENSSVKALQALVILALDLTGTSNGPPGWNLLALITRSVVQLGLSVEATSTMVSPSYPSIYTLRAMVLPEPKSWIEDESRRRLFWMVYLLDRYATIATAFEFALDEKEIDRKLPCRDDLFSRNRPVETRWFHTSERSDYSLNHPENLGSFSYYCEILGVISRIHRFLKHPVDIGALSDVEEWQRSYRDLDAELSSWKFGLPNEYGNMSRLFTSNSSNTKGVNGGWVMLHATYQFAIIRLHSSAAYPTTRSPIFTPSYSAAQKCLTAVENVTQLGHYVVNSGMLDKLGPPFAFTLWVCARLLLVHGSTIDHKVSPEIMFFVSTLAQMGKYWQVAQRYSDILNRVLEEYQASERGPVNARGERVTPSTVRILADMRRCAYDLDFLISRQPRPIAQSSLYANATGTTPTPMRTPAPNELEYLDVFDFFNMPRLPVSHDVNGNLNGDTQGAGPQGIAMGNGTGNGEMMGEFNITNYMVPNPESDWLFKAGA